jgi:hypothetical protein
MGLLSDCLSAGLAAGSERRCSCQLPELREVPGWRCCIICRAHSLSPLFVQPQTWKPVGLIMLADVAVA